MENLDNETIEIANEDRTLVSIIPDIHHWFDESAFEKASEDLTNLFLKVFSKAKVLSVSEAEDDNNPKIKKGQWNRSFWNILEEKKNRGRYGYWKVFFRWANRVIPFIIGFVVDPKIVTAPNEVDPRILLPILIFSFIYWITTMIEEKMEVDK